MDDVKNCLSCLYEPEWHAISAPSGGKCIVGYCGYFNDMPMPVPIESCRILKSEEEPGTLAFRGEHGIGFVEDCPAHQPKERQS